MTKYVTSREPRTDLEDLRDDTIAVVINSGMTFAAIQAAGGPTSTTLAKWLYKETKFPRLDTVRSILQICGYDIQVAAQFVPEKTERLLKSIRPRARDTLPARSNLRAWNRLRKQRAT